MDFRRFASNFTSRLAPATGQEVSLTALDLASYRYFRAVNGFVALNLTKAFGEAVSGLKKRL